MLKKLDVFLQEANAGDLPTPPPNAPTPQNINNAEEAKSISPVKQKIEDVVNESPDLISALESVGAMYGIPATNIISDDTATGISVRNDNIIAPPIPNPTSQIKPIMQSIGSVLDYISQRIDDKLNNFQMDNIKQGHINDMIANANPNKGKCVGHYEDDEGGEILAYDTGLVDSPHTPAAMAKIAELRQTNQIPNFDPSDNRPSGISGLSYFTDEDDITNDVDMSGGDSGASDTGGMEETDVSDAVQESAYHLNMISKFNNTKHLGHDLLQKHGFYYVKPVDSIIMEGGDSLPDKNIKLEDFKHMKFDNTELLKAVECFNKARANQGTTKNGKMSISTFVRDPSFNEGISHIEKQFDCHLVLKHVKTKSGEINSLGTEIMPDVKQKVTVSKSKGFQLNGLMISVVHLNRFFENNTPDDRNDLFGQRMVGVLCHEIFHNIAAALRYESVRNTATFTMTMNLATAAKTSKEKRVIITNYVESMDKLYDSKLFDKMVKKRLIKKLSILASVKSEQDIKNAKKALANPNSDDSPDEFMDKLIKRADRYDSKTNFGRARYQFRHILNLGLSIFLISLKPHMLWIDIPLAILSFLNALEYITDGIDHFSTKKKKKSEDNPRSFEEYYCDLFASMYQLPITFFVGAEFNVKDKRTVNELDISKINKLAKLEKSIYENSKISYPTDLERTHAGVTVAKNLLKEKDIDESTRKYCQWIVDNFSDIHATDIDTIYNINTFNPKEAEDLDKHLEKIIKDNGIPITESFIRWMCADEIFKEG